MKQTMQDNGKPARRGVASVKGHPGIFKRGKSYGVSYTFRGSRKWKWHRTLTEAKRFKPQAAAGQARPTSPETFKTYAERWMRTYAGCTANGVSDATSQSYADALTHVAIPFFGTTRMDRIDAPLLREYIDHVAARPTKDGKPPAAPATVRRYYAPVRALLATAHEDGLIDRHPAHGVRVIVRDDRARVPMRLDPGADDGAAGRDAGR